MSREIGDGTVALFIKKTYDILSKEELGDIISWTGRGKEFAIKNAQALQRQILPVFFRHRNIHSFIRQLNMYGFHKSRKEPTKNIFSHEYFQRGKPDLLPLVRRKGKEDRPEDNPQSSEPLVSGRFLSQSASQRAILEDRADNLVIPELFKRESSGKPQVRPEGLSLQSMIIKSSLLQGSHPQVYSNLHNNSSVSQSESDQDRISIDGEIEKERQQFRNRTSGVSLVHTRNLLQSQNQLRSSSDI